MYVRVGAPPRKTNRKKPNVELETLKERLKKNKLMGRQPVRQGKIIVLTVKTRVSYA